MGVWVSFYSTITQHIARLSPGSSTRPHLGRPIRLLLRADRVARTIHPSSSRAMDRGSALTPIGPAAGRYLIPSLRRSCPILPCRTSWLLQNLTSLEGGGGFPTLTRNAFRWGTAARLGPCWARLSPALPRPGEKKDFQRQRRRQRWLWALTQAV